MYSVQFSGAKWKWTVNLQMWENGVCGCPHFFPPFSGGAQSVHLWESGWFCTAWETLWACSTLSPPLLPPSLSFPLFPPPSSSCFPVLAGNWSQAVFPHPRVTSRNSLTDLPTQTHTALFLSVSALSHTRPAVDCALTSFWTSDWGASIPLFYLAAVIACSHCCVRAAWLFGEMLSW